MPRRSAEIKKLKYFHRLESLISALVPCITLVIHGRNLLELNFCGMFNFFTAYDWFQHMKIWVGLVRSHFCCPNPNNMCNTNEGIQILEMTVRTLFRIVYFAILAVHQMQNIMHFIYKEFKTNAYSSLIDNMPRGFSPCLR